MELAIEVEGYPSTPPWGLLSSSGFASKPSVFSNILETIYISSVMLLNFPQKFFCNCRSEDCCSLGFSRGGFLQQLCARDVFVWTEGGEGGNRRICNNPAATQVYSCALHTGAQL